MSTLVHPASSTKLQHARTDPGRRCKLSYLWLGVAVERVRDPEALAAVAPAARLVVVDLRLREALDALDRLRAAAPGVHSIGFIDHENVDAMEAASAHGCRTVVSKRKFASSLPALLAG